MGVLQIAKQRPLRRLLLVFTSVETFRHIGWMLFYEQFVENTRQEINVGFISYSGTILITALIIPSMLKRFGIVNQPEKLRRLFVAALCAAFLLRILQLLSGLYGAYVFLTLWTAAVMVCMCICFIELLDVVPPALLGRFVGIAYLIDAIIVGMIEWFTGTPGYYPVSILVGLLLCLAAIPAFLRQPKSRAQYSTEVDQWTPSKHVVKLGAAILILYVLTTGMIDNLYFFDDWFELPFVWQFTLPMTGAMYLLNGYLFDKMNRKTSLPIAFVFICAAQSMAFFAKEAVFAYSYSVLSSFGATFLELATLILPIHYARVSRHGGNLPALGDGLFYGGLCLTSILFVFLRQSAYLYVMGSVLLAAILCLLLLFRLIGFYEKQKHRREIEDQRAVMIALEQRMLIAEALAEAALPEQAQTADLGFTKREKQLLPLIISPLTAEEIAKQTQSSVSTIRFHIRNILGKSGAKSRRELTLMLGNQQPQPSDYTKIYEKK